MSRTKNSLRNSFWGIVYKILHMVFPVIFRAIIIRYIGAEYIGLGGLFKSVFSVLQLSEMGFASAVVYMMYKPIAENDKPTIRLLMGMLKKIYTYVGILILAIGFMIIPFLDVLVKNDTGRDVNFYILFLLYLFHAAGSYFMSAYRSSLFTAHQRSDLLFISHSFRDS